MLEIFSKSVNMCERENRDNVLTEDDILSELIDSPGRKTIIISNQNEERMVSGLGFGRNETIFEICWHFRSDIKLEIHISGNFTYSETEGRFPATGLAALSELMVVGH